MRAEVHIGSPILVVVPVIFARNQFTDEDMDIIHSYLKKNPCNDDLIGQGGQIFIDETKKIFFTGSNKAASYIREFARRSINMKYKIIIIKKNVSHLLLSIIIHLLVKSSEKEKHNLESVMFLVQD
ncbi:MAG: hypothetical protein PHS92_00295 [Candidatus Gracilibacteria bacterium]|nr:hypothetical protein [Candidatus Gracilibacteria bacterium]